MKPYYWNPCTPVHALLMAICLTAPLSPPAFGVDPLPNILIKYDFNTLTEDNDPNVPAYYDPGVTTTNLSLNSLNQGLNNGGPDGSKFRSFEGWDSVYDYNLSRTNLTQAPDSLAYDVFVQTDSMVQITGVSFDWRRPESSSVNSIQASIFWEDSFGNTQNRTSGPFSLTGTGIWNNSSLTFDSGSSPLPTGIDTSGEHFHIELYGWGGEGNTLYMDNVILNGNSAPIPEPGSAVLIATASLFLLTRRHRSH